jgi:transcriptional regulator with XRE-family HTH domain
MIESTKRSKLVGEFIRKRREALGMSQRALGQLFSPPVTTQFISNVERGVTPLPPTHIPVLAKALSTSDAEIMVLLEKEYALKLNGRLGRGDEDLKNGLAVNPALIVASNDYDFIKTVYEAYKGADVNTRQAFVSVCENVLKVNKQHAS